MGGRRLWEGHNRPPSLKLQTLAGGLFWGGVLHSLAHDPAEAPASWVEPALWDG